MYSIFQHKNKTLEKPDVEAEAAGELGEDEDVRRERRRVSSLLHASPENPQQAPALLVHVRVF